MAKLKLQPKQAAALAQFQAQKQQLATALQEVNQKESLVAELIFEAAGVDITTIENLKLEEDSLVYDVKEAKEAKPKGKKKEAPMAG